MKFNEPFHGIIQAEYDRSSACRVNGKGALSYKLELPLKGCGTLQVMEPWLVNKLYLPTLAFKFIVLIDYY